MNIIEFHRMDANNPGDWYSNPSRYFFPGRSLQIDIDNVRRTTWHQKDIIIVGGGGLIGNDNFESLMERLSKHPDEQLLIDILETKLKNVTGENKETIGHWKDKVRVITLNTLNSLDKSIGPRILWGAGYNSRDKDKDPYYIDYPAYINQFHLIGVRDWNTDYRWVPCASCMHSAFDKKYEIKNKVVWFEHKKKLIDGKWFDSLPAPRMVNTGQNIEQIIEFLGSAEIVVTNSYHGVYWATLLNRKVVCVPWGSKFSMFRHPPVMANERNWAELINDAVNYPSALEECRTANKEFHNDVLKLVDEMTT